MFSWIFFTFQLIVGLIVAIVMLIALYIILFEWEW